MTWGREFRGWLATRPWRLLIYSLPTLLALLIGLGVVVMMLIQGRIDMDWRYERLARYFISTKQYESARITCLRELNVTRNEQDRARWLYYLAEAMNGMGQVHDAVALVNAAAPLDHPGYALAHLMVAQSLLNSTNVTGLSSEALRNLSLDATNAAAATLRLAERHLLNALAADSNSVVANELLGRFYINTHSPAKARTYLMKIYSAKPDVALLLALSRVQENDSANALLWANRALTAYEKKLMDAAPHYDPSDRQGLVQALGVQQLYAPPLDPVVTAPPINTTTNAVDASVATTTNTPPQDSPGFWMGMVRLLLLKGKYAAALQTLDQQMLASTNPVYSAAAADICATWLDTMPANTADLAATRLQLIQKGLANDPHHHGLQLDLVQASHAQDESAPAATKLMAEAMASATGEAAAWWHFVLCADARARGDAATARQELHAAFELGPQIPEVKNDMAMELANGSKEDVEQALKLIQSLLDMYPVNPHLRDSRGQILAKLGRNEEALADLEFAVPRLQHATESEQLMKKLYIALGRTPPTPQVHTAALLSQVRDLVDQRKYADALSKLEAGMRDTPNEAYASTIGDICVTWISEIPPAQAAERLRLIQKGLSYAPQQPELSARLIQAAQLPGDSGLAAKKALNQLVDGATGDTAAQWHLFLGQDARSNGDLAVARQHFQKAYDLAPQNREIQAAFALALAGGNQSDLEQGLKLIQPLVDDFPQSPDFRNTRGLLLARLGQNAAAVTDLEFAVTHVAHPATSQLELAKVYDALGKAKQAEAMRRLATAGGSIK